jgi:hypothetical protein
MTRLLARLLRRAVAPAPRGEDEGDRLLRIYRQTVREMQDLRRAA